MTDMVQGGPEYFRNIDEKFKVLLSFPHVFPIFLSAIFFLFYHDFLLAFRFFLTVFT